MTTRPLQNSRILGTRVDATSYSDAAARIIDWTRTGEGRYVCCCNVHMVMEGYDDPAFRQVVNAADLVTPDGMPLVWGLRLSGLRNATRVDGSSLTLAVCETAAREGVSIGLYGGTEETIAAFTVFIKRRFPDLRIATAISPAYGQLSAQEDAAHIEKLTAAGARIVFVALGCPKQEKWMHAHRDHLPAVTLGVGAALDFHAGRIPRAPHWMQKSGLEWFFRLMLEPRRLWRRYFIHNPRFIGLLLLQLLRLRRFDES